MKYSALVRVPAALTALMSAVPVDEKASPGDVQQREPGADEAHQTGGIPQ